MWILTVSIGAIVITGRLLFPSPQECERAETVVIERLLASKVHKFKTECKFYKSQTVRLANADNY